MAAAMGVGGGGKPAKLNTLEKSKLDWTSCVAFPSLAHSLGGICFSRTKHHHH